MSGVREREREKDREKNDEESQSRVVGVPAEIPTGHFSNISHKTYCSSRPSQLPIIVNSSAILAIIATSDLCISLFIALDANIDDV
jgi:hypothetical protein